MMPKLFILLEIHDPTYFENENGALWAYKSIYEF